MKMPLWLFSTRIINFNLKVQEKNLKTTNATKKYSKRQKPQKHHVSSSSLIVLNAYTHTSSLFCPNPNPNPENTIS